MTKSKVMILLSGSAMALGVAYGCANTATCDPNEVLKNGMCLSRGSGAKPEAADAGHTDGGPDLTCGPGATATGTFGADCHTNTDCGCPAPVCAIQPSDPKGFCTQMNCATNAAVCPAGWHCFDASVLNPDYPQLCVKD